MSGMETARALRTDHSHLFPGSRLGPADPATPAEIPAAGEVVVLFSDGSSAEAELSPQDSGPLLRVQAYRTAAGTPIAQKSWRLQVEDRHLKVLGPAA